MYLSVGIHDQRRVAVRPLSLASPFLRCLALALPGFVPCWHISSFSLGFRASQQSPAVLLLRAFLRHPRLHPLGRVKGRRSARPVVHCVTEGVAREKLEGDWVWDGGKGLEMVQDATR